MRQILLLMAMPVLFTACSHSWDACGDAYCIDVQPPQHLSGVGAAQGLDVRDGLIWVIGDADSGVARAFTLEPDGKLAAAGSEVALTVNGADLVPHPTGFTDQPGAGTFLGNTVGGRGEILLVDWGAATASGTFDGAVINRVADDEAHNGARPELVWVDNRWLIATADYGDGVNELRLYDPDFLLTALNTSDPNVVVMRFPAPPMCSRCTTGRSGMC